MSSRTFPIDVETPTLMADGVYTNTVDCDQLNANKIASATFATTIQFKDSNNNWNGIPFQVSLTCQKIGKLAFLSVDQILISGSVGQGQASFVQLAQIILPPSLITFLGGSVLTQYGCFVMGMADANNFSIVRDRVRSYEIKGPELNYWLTDPSKTGDVNPTVTPIYIRAATYVLRIQ